MHPALIRAMVIELMLEILFWIDNRCSPSQLQH